MILDNAVYEIQQSNENNKSSSHKISISYISPWSNESLFKTVPVIIENWSCAILDRIWCYKEGCGMQGNIASLLHDADWIRGIQNLNQNACVWVLSDRRIDMHFGHLHWQNWLIFTVNPAWIIHICRNQLVEQAYCDG